MKTYHSPENSKRFIIAVIIITILLSTAAFFIGYFTARRYDSILSDAYNKASSEIDSIQHQVLEEISKNA